MEDVTRAERADDVDRERRRLDARRRACTALPPAPRVTTTSSRPRRAPRAAPRRLGSSSRSARRGRGRRGRGPGSARRRPREPARRAAHAVATWSTCTHSASRQSSRARGAARRAAASRGTATIARLASPTRIELCGDRAPATARQLGDVDALGLEPVPDPAPASSSPTRADEDDLHARAARARRPPWRPGRRRRRRDRSRRRGRPAPGARDRRDRVERGEADADDHRLPDQADAAAAVPAEQASRPSPGEEVQPPRIDREPERLADLRLRARVDARGEQRPLVLGEQRRPSSSSSRRASSTTTARVDLEEDERVGAELLEHLDLDVDLRQPGLRERGVLERLRPDPDDRRGRRSRRAAGARGRAGCGSRRTRSRRRAIVASTRFIDGEPMNAATKRFVGLVVERLRRVDLLDPPVAHDGDALAERHRLDLVVRDVDRRRRRAARAAARAIGAHRHAQLRVEVRERLVHQEGRRLADDRAAHRDALPLAAGELRRACGRAARSRPSSSPTSSTRRSSSCSRRLAHAQAEAEVLRARSCAGRARSSGRPSRRRGAAARASVTSRSPIEIRPAVTFSSPRDRCAGASSCRSPTARRGP